MSWFTELFGPVLRVFGVGRPKDRRIPAPGPGSELLSIDTDANPRSIEAVAAIRGFLRDPYRIEDRRFFIATVSWDEGRAFFARYGYDPRNWTKTRQGNFYPPRTGIVSAPIIHLVDTRLDQPRRVFLALHEYGHAIWHYLLRSSEWDEWNMRGWSYEQFADDFARRLMGEKLSRDKAQFFDRLESRLAESGSKPLRP